MFMKLDLRWGYNNVRIKERDEWKAAFTTHIGAYEPTVMYFGLTNSSATFQTMMNDLFRDLINQGDMATFIDDILVATDTEEGHDDDGDQREFDLETRVTTNGNSKSLRCFTVVH